jgi:plasmid stabilization system protein ParE
MIVAYRAEAVEDLRRIARWYRKHRPEGEARFFDRFRTTMRRIQEFPAVAPKTHIGEFIVQKARVLRTAYSIALVHEGDTIRILAVVHGSRSPSYWKRRTSLGG